MRTKHILSFLLSLLIILNNNLFAQTCEQYTISQAGTNLDNLKKIQKLQQSNGYSSDSDGKIFCQIDEVQKTIDGNKCKVIVKAMVADSNSPDPKDNIKCVKFYIDLKDKNPDDAVERILETPGFLEGAGLMNEQIDYNSIHTTNISKLKSLKEKLKNKADIVSSNITNYNSVEEKTKVNFLDEFTELKVYDPTNYINKKAFETPMVVSLEEETSEVNPIFKECKEKVQKIPSFSLEDMLDSIKSSIFDLEGQLEDATTNILDNIEDSIMDITSDEAMFVYSIQALTKIIALGVCKFRRFSGFISGNVTATVAATASSVAPKACKTKLNIPDVSSTGEKAKEDSCWALGTISSCFFKTFAGITLSYIGTVRKSTNKDKKACEALEEAIKNKAYEACLDSEPDKIMRYILKIINLSVNGGEVEIGLVKKCNDKELENRYKNKNYFDKAGNPYKNRITSFLNKAVDTTQTDIRDRLLGYVDDTLDAIKKEVAIDQKPQKYTDLISSIKNNLEAKNFKNKYPQISIELYETYQKNYKNFQKFIRQEQFNKNIKEVLNILTGVRLNGNGNPPFGISNDLKEVLINSDKFVYRLIATLPAYDYYMNFFIGEDITGLYQIPANSSSDPKQLNKVFTGTSDYIEDTDAIADSFSQIMMDSMMTYYDVWKKVLEHLSTNFAFDYIVKDGELTYIIPINEIKNIIKSELYKVFLDRYNTKKDSNGVLLKNFNIYYIIDRLHKLEVLAQKAQSSGNPDDEKKISKYILEYTQLILDYNLYMSTYEESNPYSLISIVDDTNINLQNYFSQMTGTEVEEVQTNFKFFLKMLDIKNKD